MPILKPQQIIGGYEILTFHSRGGMGEIYRAKQLSIGREVALKLLHPEMMRKDPTFARKFVDEARAAGSLNHPNIIAVHDVGRVKIAGSEESLFYFSMEFVEGEDLKHIFKRQSRMSIEDLAKILPGVIDALAYGEAKNMVHRDIKPENIMIASNGLVKLADFGIALQTDSIDATELERDEQGRVKVMGTPRYMSPEQARGKAIDTRSDQYSLGATIFHLLTGQPPYEGRTAKEIMRAHVLEPVPDPSEIADIPHAWAALTMRMMAKDPDDRFPNVEALRDAVAGAIEGKIRRVLSQRCDTTAPTVTGKRHLIFVGVVLLVLVIAGVILLVQQFGSSRNPNPVDNGRDHGTTPVISDAFKLAKVEDLISSLPTGDPVAALAIVDGSRGLKNSYFEGEGQARERLLECRLKLVGDIQQQQEERRKALLGRLNDIQQLLTHHKLKAAKELLGSFTAEDRQLITAMVEPVDGAIIREEASLLREAQQRLNSEESPEAVRDRLTRLHDDGFSTDNLAMLATLADERIRILKELAAKNAAEREKQDIAAWDLLIQHVQDYRFRNEGTPVLPQPSRLRDDLDHQLKVVQTPAIQTKLASLRHLTDRCLSVEQAVDAFLGSGKAKISSDWGQVTIYEYQNFRLRFALPNSEIKTAKYIYEPEINWLVLAQDAIRAAKIPADEQDLDLAAYFWFWRSDHGVKYFTRLADHPQTALMQSIDHQLFTAKIAAQDKVIIDFAKPDERWKSLWANQELKLTGAALRWRTSQRWGAGSPTDFPKGFSLDTAKPEPTSLEAVFTVGGNSKIILCFTREDGRPVRLAFDTSSDRIGGLVINEGGNLEPRPKIPRMMADFGKAEPTRLIATFSKDTIRFTINDQDFGTEFPFSGTGSVQFQLQTFQRDAGSTSTVDLFSLKVDER